MVYITTLAYPFACCNHILPTLKYLKITKKSKVFVLTPIQFMKFGSAVLGSNTETPWV